MPCWQRFVTSIATPFGHLQQLARDEWKLLKRGDDNWYRTLQRLGQLPGTLVDLLHHAALVLELVDRVLQLLVENHTVVHDNDAVEDAFVPCVVERGQSMGQPTNGVTLSAPRRVLDKIIVPHALLARRLHEGTHRLKLVVAREDHRLLLDLAALIVVFLLDLKM